MTIDLNILASRPASSITDEEVAAAIEIIRADARVTKAIHVGRENSAADGRQMIDFEIPGFAGVHTLGRVISALGEEARLNAAAAAKKAATDAKAAKKDAADRAELLKLVPAPGKNNYFERHLAAIGRTDAVDAERAALYVEYMLPRLDGLTGSIKQRVWAADLRVYHTSAPMFDEKRAAILKKFKSAKFWIDNRNVIALHKQLLEAVK